MLVKVSEGYGGYFGLSVAETNSIRAKRAGDPPFELDDALAERHIKSGVLVLADGSSYTPAPETEPAAESVDIPSDWEAMKARAKELGINPVGKSKAALADMIREASEAEEAGDDDGAPVLEAADPV